MPNDNNLFASENNALVPFSSNNLSLQPADMIDSFQRHQTETQKWEAYKTGIQTVGNLATEGLKAYMADRNQGRIVEVEKYKIDAQTKIEGKKVDGANQLTQLKETNRFQLKIHEQDIKQKKHEHKDKMSHKRGKMTQQATAKQMELILECRKNGIDPKEIGIDVEAVRISNNRATLFNDNVLNKQKKHHQIPKDNYESDGENDLQYEVESPRSP